MRTSTRLGGKASTAAGRAAESVRRLSLLTGCAALCASLPGCGSVQKVKTLVTGPSSPYLTGYIGEVVADEPRAALAARDILARGGNAADAAAALGMSLAVTLPSRASLGAGGACLAFDAGAPGTPEAILFTPVAGSDAQNGAGPNADRPASVPMLARGLFLLQTRHGRVGFDEITRPAADLARNGVTVSRALAEDLAQVREPLLDDPRARQLFAAGGDTVAISGDKLVQPDLASVLDRIIQAGVGDLYTGVVAQQFVSGADAAGGGVDIETMRSALPTVQKPLLSEDGRISIAFLPPPADGGLATAASFDGKNGTALVAAWRAAHPRPQASAQTVEAAQAALESASAASNGGAALGRLPASTSFVVLDRSGNAVSCAITMNNLFGTGRIAGDTGIMLGASPARLPAPLLAASIAWNRSDHSFRAAVAASGQNQAAAAAADALHNALSNLLPLVRRQTETGRANVISCAHGLPGDQTSCEGATDPRGAGLAVGSN